MAYNHKTMLMTRLPISSELAHNKWQNLKRKYQKPFKKAPKAHKFELHVPWDKVIKWLVLCSRLYTYNRERYCVFMLA